MYGKLFQEHEINGMNLCLCNLTWDLSGYIYIYIYIYIYMYIYINCHFQIVLSRPLNRRHQIYFPDSRRHQKQKRVAYCCRP